MAFAGTEEDVNMAAQQDPPVKRKADDAALGEGGGPHKELRTEEETGVRGGETETDTRADNRPKITEQIHVDPTEMTLNVVPTTGGRLLMALSEGGMQYLVACARANVGVFRGRYLFEVRIIEVLGGAGDGRRQMPKQHVRIGVSTGGSTLFLGETGDSVCFDSEGYFIADKKRQQSGSRFSRDQVIGIFMNLEEGSPNAHTVSLFRDGERVSEPLALPEGLRGKALFPHVSFRNVSVQINYGPESMTKMPFDCRMLQCAAIEDAEVSKAVPVKDGKYEVLMPICLPDEGTFDWLETFLEKNPQYVELSDRKIVDWAVKSGIWKPKNSTWKNSNDKPDVNFGIPSLDDLSARRVIQAVAPLVPRNYVIMEVKSNLIQGERAELLSRFSTSKFRRVANVVIGEPSEEYKARIHGEILREKQILINNEWQYKAKLKQKQAAEHKRGHEAPKEEDGDATKKEALKEEDGEATKKEAEDGEATKKEMSVAAPMDSTVKIDDSSEVVVVESVAKEAPEVVVVDGEAKEAPEASKEEDGDATKKEASKEEDGDATKKEASKEEDGDATKKEAPKEEDVEARKQEAPKEEDVEARKQEAPKEEDVEARKQEAPKEEDGEARKQEAFKEEDNEATKKEASKEEDAEATNKEASKEDGGEATEKEEVKEDEEMKKEEEEEDEELSEPPKAELTEEDKKQWFRYPAAITDLHPQVLTQSFPHFSIPDASEGFSEITYEWQDEAGTKEYLRSWVLQKKVTTRVEDLQPSEWFFTRLSEWQKVLQEWQLRQKDYKQDPARRLAAQRAKERIDRVLVDGVEVVEGEKGTEEKEGAEEKEACENKEENADEKKEEVADPDVFLIEDVCDIGDGEPLFANFMFEDWALMSLRFELHLLVKTFKKDVNDPERPGIHETHLPFYYNKYYRKQLNTKFFGMATTAELVDMVKDTVAINHKTSIIVPQLADDVETTFDMFVKLTEEARRERQRRIDAGDESAKLRFSVLAASNCPSQQAGQQRGGSPAPKTVMPPAGGVPRGYQTSSWQQQNRPWGPRGWGPGVGGGPTVGGYRPLQMVGGRWPQQTYAPKSRGW